MNQHTPFSVILAATKKYRELAEREVCEDNLYKFLQAGWKYIDPAPFIGGWHLEAIAEHLEAVTRGQIRRLIINVPPRSSKSSLCSVAWPAWTWAQSKTGPCAGPQVQFLSASYAQTLSLRDSVKNRRLIESPWYKRIWGDRFSMTSDVNTKGRFENDKGGYRLATSVDGALTGEGGQVISIDDAHNATEIESDLVRKSTIMWWDEAMSTRLNDPATGAFVITMQRLHQEDLTGHVITKDQDGWVWLMLPMEHDLSRHCVTYVNGDKFWEDPRTEENELLCEERFPREHVERLKKELGPFACTPAESPILMADLSMRPISQVRVGDELVGFTTDIGDERKRRALVRSKVLNTFEYIADVVRITLSSGRIVRCTPDHKWYMGKGGGNRGLRQDGTRDMRPFYRPAIVGRKLMRVCPPSIVIDPKLEREAGWLAGFFDGEGSVSNCEKRGQLKHDGTPYRPSISISFYQTADKNLPICERLERTLETLDFSYSIIGDGRTRKGWQPKRQYRLNGLNLPLCQKFLHVIRPGKWRERIIQGAYGSKFIVEQETVVSIEPDGQEKVYALETETGNYVVWGLASSNSAGQLQQFPTPRGGGIIKEEWWQLWEDERYPVFEYLLASVDTAYTTKQENDPSALTIWGVFREPKTGNMKIMLVWAWEGRLELPDLVEELFVTCTSHAIPNSRLEKHGNRPRFPVHTVLIEAKAAGLPLAQEVWRMLAGQNAPFRIQFPDQNRGKYTQDKVARLYAVQHIFADKMVYAPDRPFADKVISQVSVFPKGAHDDLVDTTSQAIRFLRDSGMLLRREEQALDLDRELQYRSRPLPLYPA